MNPNAFDPMVSQKTIENLQENFRRESVSSGKYNIYAQKLQEAGYEALANFFHACSHSEIVHATRHSRVALILGIKLETDVVECKAETVEEILREMLQEEQDAMDDYPRFLKDAEGEQYASVVMTMSVALKADRTHYNILKKLVETRNCWKGEKHQFYACALCGYVHEKLRRVCPICGAKPEIFLPFPDDGYFGRDWPFYGEAETSSESALPSVGEIWYFEQSYPTKLVNAVGFTTTVTEVLEQNGWPQAEIYGIVLSVTEAAVNANEHGNKGADDKEVHVECSIADDFFFCSMQDDGDGFIPKNVPNPCLEENRNITHGRGLKLIDNFMTNVWFNNKGNKIFMLKKR